MIPNLASISIKAKHSILVKHSVHSTTVPSWFSQYPSSMIQYANTTGEKTSARYMVMILTNLPSSGFHTYHKVCKSVNIGKEQVENDTAVLLFSFCLITKSLNDE